MDSSGAELSDHFRDSGGEAVLLTDEAGRVVAANPAACHLFGRTEREICELGRPGLEGDTDPHAASRGARRADRGRFVAETTFLRGDGTTFPAQTFMGAPLRQEGASPLTPMIVRDLTAQRLAEVELEEYRRRFEDLLKERAAEMREAAARVRQESDERRQVEAEARASEERFRILVEGSSDLILIVDAEARVTLLQPVGRAPYRLSPGRGHRHGRGRADPRRGSGSHRGLAPAPRRASLAPRLDRGTRAHPHERRLPALVRMVGEQSPGR